MIKINTALKDSRKLSPTSQTLTERNGQRNVHPP